MDVDEETRGVSKESGDGVDHADEQKSSNLSRKGDSDQSKTTGGEIKEGGSSRQSTTNNEEVIGNNNGNRKDGKNNLQKRANGSGAAAKVRPVMRGTLFYEGKEKGRRHVIRGMWNYEDTNLFPPQRFALFRDLGKDEDLEKLPVDGEFSGSFSCAYYHTTSKGERKERIKVIPESGVKIKFLPINGKNEYKMNGTGTNQFGVFNISGTAKPSEHDDDIDMVWNIEFRKSYKPSPSVSTDTTQPISNKAIKSKKIGSADWPPDESRPLPEPSELYTSGVFCLRGKLEKLGSDDLGMYEVIHRVRGVWASGMDLIVAVSEGTQGRVSKFEYEHKSMVPTADFPVSGRYSGWFDLINDDGSSTRINEEDFTLKFRKNRDGYHNVEGKGTDVFGKYNITGTLTLDHTLTIFRNFQPRKFKPPKAVTSAPPPINAPQAKTSPVVGMEEMTLNLGDVEAPEENGKGLDPIRPPANTTYSAVSQGTLRVDSDGSHTCSGKWAVARDHLTNDSMTSAFNVRLDALHAQEATKSDQSGVQFPVDSAMYKGSFQLKKGVGSRVQSQKIVDQQVVMKFRMNSEGFYNVYGKGVNAIGIFTLIGTLIVSSKSAGRVELYRTYPSDMINKSELMGEKQGAPTTTFGVQGVAPDEIRSGSKLLLPGPGQPPLGNARRESSRLVKLPSKLEDDDPSAQLTRAMEKCSQLLKIMCESDLQAGGFFGEPVDPVKLNIPTYFQIIKEPMDLKTIGTRMENGQIKSPEEFARLVRLVFENAVKFNIDPAHSVHRAARNLLTLFTKKYRDVERMVQTIRKAQGDDDKGKKKKGKKQLDKPKTQREIRLEEAQTMATENAKAVAAITAAIPSDAQAVTREEFSLVLAAIQQMQQHMVQTHTLLAGLFPGEDESTGGTTRSVPATTVSSTPVEVAPAPLPERKKPVPKRKSEVLKPEPVVVPLDDAIPLTIAEQTLLTETINELDQEHLGGVIQIIREAAPVSADEDEIDLEIDQLDTKTQRKLLRHVSKFVKKPQSKAKKQRTSNAQPKKAKAQSSPKAEAAEQPTTAVPALAPKPKPTTDALFSFGKDDSESDSDDEPGIVSAAPQNSTKPTTGGKQFKLGDDLDDDDDDDNEYDFGSAATNWNISKPDADSSKKEGDDDDAWGAAREAAAAGKLRDAERKAREKKIEIEAEMAKNQRLADAAARGEEIKAQRAEEEAKEAELREQQEKEAEEARNAAREAARAQVQSVEQTVDLEAQRDIMKMYEPSFTGGDYGNASPSSDFGF